MYRLRGVTHHIIFHGLVELSIEVTEVLTFDPAYIAYDSPIKAVSNRNIFRRHSNPRISTQFVRFCFVSECEYKFVSRPGGPQNGTFSAPRLTNPHNHSYMCVYIFFAGPHQKVEITFLSFNLRGTPPE